MRTTFALCLLVLALFALPLAAASDAAESSEAAIVAPAPSCYQPIVKRCCSAVGAKLSVDCEVDGVKWSCTSTPTANPLFKTTVKVDTGWKVSYPTGQTVDCVYREPVCGTSAGACSTSTIRQTKTCVERDVGTTYCETPQHVDD